ncbi:MAG TPA: hypothetical protein VK750_07590, partial [Cytophagaceae bacterium]|nr:hypothetical protein [Cytophagaceae bacterium]
MAFKRRQFIAILFAGLVLVNGCALKQMVKLAKNQELTVTPNPLEVHGDSVAFQMTALLPLKMLKKNKIYTVDLRYQYGEQKVDLQTLEFVATDYPNAKTEQPKVSKHYAFAYKPEIGNGDLIAVGTAFNLAKTKSKKTVDFPVAKGLITTSRLVKDYYYVAYADHGYNNKEELEPTAVDFFFEQGKSKLRPSETKGTNGKFLDAFIAKKNITRTVTIVGSHSPEGREAKNTELANERAKVIEEYTKARLKHYGYHADSINFVAKGLILDWEGLKKELTTTTHLDEAQKTEILNIINGSGDFHSKEEQIEKLPSFKIVFNKLYPSLRVAKTEILTVKKKKSDAEIGLLAKSITDGTVKLDTLNENELAYAATLTPVLSQKEAIYQALVKKNDSWVAHNNLGAVYLEEAKREADETKRASLVDKAVTAFNLSLKKQESGEAHVNLASASLMKGVRPSARTEAQKAADGATSTDAVKKGANGILGVLDIKDGKYDGAI